MDIFNRTIIYNTIFLNIQSVTEYPDTRTFEDAEPEKFKVWLEMAKKRYTDEFAEFQKDGNTYRKTIDDLYLDKACFLPEFSKIVAISYATVTAEDGKLKRNLKTIEGETEFDLIKEFHILLTVAYETTANASPKQPMYNLCGHNIMGHDIPLLVKRIIKYRKELKEDPNIGDHIIPQLIKKYLTGKPWDSNVIDTTQLWKFNGTDYISMKLISEFMELKKTVNLSSMGEMNREYWAGIEDDKGSLMKEINRRSANYTNLAFQLVNEMRLL